MLQCLGWGKVFVSARRYYQLHQLYLFNIKLFIYLSNVIKQNDFLIQILNQLTYFLPFKGLGSWKQGTQTFLPVKVKCKKSPRNINPNSGNRMPIAYKLKTSLYLIFFRLFHLLGDQTGNFQIDIWWQTCLKRNAKIGVDMHRQQQQTPQIMK